ncbi:MAG TPA: zinc-dependent peptidase [Saprospiraceae bacterium]|nr:zinc-dependent peptidase [Saprospiraceae bacterium]
MTSRRIIILAAIALAGSGYFIFFKDRDDFLFLFSISLIVLMITYIFQYQIDQLMTRGMAQKIPGPMHDMLMNTAPHFSRMTVQEKLLVADRMKRWIVKKEFISQNEQDAPEDVKFILAYYAILLTMHQEEFRYDGLDRIVFYHHPFLTPQHPDDVHIIEVEPKDGTIIISVPDLLKGHLEKGHYNVALHAMADAYRIVYMHKNIDWSEDIWQQLENISSIDRQRLEDYIGLPLSDPWPVAVHHQLMYKGSHIDEVLNEFPQFNFQVEKVK